MPFIALSEHASIHNAIAALADAVAAQLEINAEHIEAFTEELKLELATTVNETASGVSPDMCATNDMLTPPPGDFDGFDDTNAHGFYGTYTTDAGGL